MLTKCGFNLEAYEERYFQHITAELLHNLMFNTFPRSYYSTAKTLTEFIRIKVNVIHGVRYSKRIIAGKQTITWKEDHRTRGGN